MWTLLNLLVWRPLCFLHQVSQLAERHFLHVWNIFWYFIYNCLWTLVTFDLLRWINSNALPYSRSCASPLRCGLSRHQHYFKYIPMSRILIVFSQMRPVLLTRSTSRVYKRRRSVLLKSIQETSTRTNRIALENCCWGFPLYGALIRPLWNSFSSFVSWVKLQLRHYLGICCYLERQQAGLTCLVHRAKCFKTSGDFGISVELHAGATSYRSRSWKEH